MKETEIQATICDYLALKRYFFWRQNTAPTFDKARNVYRAMPKYAMRGVADIIIIKDGKAIFLEVKNEKGRQSEHQKDFEWAAVQAGATYKIVRSIEDVQRIGL